MFKDKEARRKMISLRATVRSLDAEADRLWHANKKLRLRVHQLEEHTKHVEKKLTKLNIYNKIQVMINQEALDHYKNLEERVKKLEPKKKEAKKK
jgi:chromosome segregation ATPase